MPPNGSKIPNPHDQSQTVWARPAEWLRALLGVLALTACAVGIYYLSSDARHEINRLATASADSTQWALAQSEVELLALLSELHRSDLSQDEHVTNVRRRFDVLYSRIATMRQSTILAELRDDPQVRENLDQIGGLLEELIPMIDGPDANLIAALPVVADQIEASRPIVRAISLSGVDYFSRTADAQRERVTTALIRLGILIFLLIAALSGVVLALVKSRLGSARRDKEKAEAQKRMEVIVTTSLDAIIVVDLDGRVIEFNKAAEKIFGYRRDEILNRKMSDAIVPEKYHEAHEIGMNRYLETREKRVVGQGRVQLEGKHKSGRVFPVELSISSVMGADGEIFISYLRDISNRVAKQEELVRARDEAVAGERAKAELVAVMSHEMRTPLNGIVGALEVLTTTKLDKTQTHMTDVMETSANMLLQHVNDVLDMSRLEAGAAEQIKRPFDPVDVTRELLRSLKMSAHNHGNTLELKALDPHFKLVLGDPAKLRQILTNLVGNAIKFTRNGTITVEIEPHPAQGLWELRVSDQGIGIAEEDFAKIFDDFVTLDPSYTRAQEGTGLGLAIVRRLVEHLGGEIGVESVLGEGSVFWVKLPTNMLSHGPDATDVATLPAGGLGDEAPSEHLSILLVEDNEINRVVAREMLEKLGHRVVEAHNGIEGVEIANLQKFDVILMDISMPEMDGLQATQLIKSGGGLNSDTPIHAVTAHAMPTDIERFGAAGMADVLIKPIGLDRLAGLLAAKPPSAPGGNSGDLLWDRAVFDEMATAMGPDKLSTVLAQFTTEMNAACQGVFSVTHVDDPAALKSEVHRLAGSAAIVGARALRETLHRAEAHLDAANGADALRELASVEECWGNTQAAMPTPHG